MKTSQTSLYSLKLRVQDLDGSVLPQGVVRLDARPLLKACWEFLDLVPPSQVLLGDTCQNQRSTPCVPVCVCTCYLFNPEVGLHLWRRTGTPVKSLSWDEGQQQQQQEEGADGGHRWRRSCRRRKNVTSRQERRRAECSASAERSSTQTMGSCWFCVTVSVSFTKNKSRFYVNRNQIKIKTKRLWVKLAARNPLLYFLNINQKWRVNVSSDVEMFTI